MHEWRVPQHAPAHSSATAKPCCRAPSPVARPPAAKPPPSPATASASHLQPCGRQPQACRRASHSHQAGGTRSVRVRAAAADDSRASHASQPPPPPPPPPRHGSGGGADEGNGSSGDEQPQPPPLAAALAHTQLRVVVLALAATSGALLVAVAWLAGSEGSVRKALAVVERSLEGMADGPSTRDSVAALKRLLREVFAEQLSLKQRLAAAEKAAGAQLEAADDYALQQLAGAAEPWGRAPVRLTGLITAAGALPWTQEADGAAAQSSLAALGVAGAADLRVQLHSVLAGGKRRLTAELAQGTHTGRGAAAAAAAAGAPALRLTRLLYRVKAGKRLQLMVAPLGGGLDVFGRSATPVQSDFGCTAGVRQGHGLTALAQRGSGKAVSVFSRALSATAGLFVNGSSTAGVGQLQVRSQDGKSLSLVAAHCRRRSRRQQPGSSGAVPGAGASSAQRLRFLGVCSPHTSSSSDSGGSSSSSSSSGSGSSGSGGGGLDGAPDGAVVGAAAVLPLGDAVTATAWAEQPAGGRPGCGVGLFVQPDTDGLELAVSVGRGSAWVGQPQDVRPPLFCEVSARVPAGGGGLSISPCAVLSHRDGATSLAYVMQSSWRF